MASSQCLKAVGCHAGLSGHILEHCVKWIYNHSYHYVNYGNYMQLCIIDNCSAVSVCMIVYMCLGVKIHTSDVETELQTEHRAPREEILVPLRMTRIIGISWSTEHPMTYPEFWNDIVAAFCILKSCQPQKGTSSWWWSALPDAPASWIQMEQLKWNWNDIEMTLKWPLILNSWY